MAALKRQLKDRSGPCRLPARLAGLPDRMVGSPHYKPVLSRGRFDTGPEEPWAKDQQA